MKRSIVAALLLAVSVGAIHAQAEADFGRGLAYYLLNDLDLARRSFDRYWRANPQPTIRAGYTLLLADDKWEATKKFKDYLDSDHRSLPALIGISLAIADMRNTDVIESLRRPLRLDPEYAPAYLCLGYEYVKRRDFPAAEEHFGKAVRYAAVPEFKVALADLYLQTGQAQKALDLIRPEADQSPDNYYFNLLAARALYRLDQLPAMAPYLEQALVSKPDSQEILLLKGRSLLAVGEFRKARSLLENLKFSRYNPEYSLLMGEVLLRLRDHKADKYLYEVFTQNRWDPAVNRLLGLYHLQRNSAAVQNWIDRALLSGNRREDLQRLFPATYRFDPPPAHAAFDIRQIHWLDGQTLLVAGRSQSGGGESLTALDAATFKVLGTWKYQGAIQEMFASPKGDRVVFSTTALENEKVYVYAFMWQPPRNSVLRPVFGNSLDMPGIVAGFSASGSMVYFTDRTLNDMAFDSPFATVGRYGKRGSIYPRFPFPVYRYNLGTDQFGQVKDPAALGGIPIPALARYLRVAEAYERNADVRALVEKGQALEITSSDEVHIVFDEPGSAFIIYFADLKNAFQALVYDPARNRVERVDQTMFLGKNRFAEGDVVRFDPQRREIFFLTRDKDRMLVVFNYGSRLYRRAGGLVMQSAYNDSTRSLLLLSERTRYLYYTETNPEIVRLEPYSRRPFSARRDFERVLRLDDFDQASFSTFNGELVSVDENGTATRVGVDPQGALWRPAPGGKRLAAFINGRLFVLPWIG